VTCRFDLKNEGNAKNQRVGFPSAYGIDILDFRVWVNGKEIAVTMVKLIPAQERNGRDPFPFRALFTVPFDSARKTVAVETRYRTRLLPNEYWGMKDLGFTYILRTGSYWKGVIGDAKVTVDFGTIAPGRISHVSPSGYTKNGSMITWRFTNFEPVTPRDDIQIHVIRKELYARMAEAFFLLAENPSSARGHYLLGAILFNRENRDIRYKNAEREFLKAVSLDPGLLDARFLLAVIYCLRYERNERREPPRKATAQLEEILKRNPDYSFRDWPFPLDIFLATHMKDTRASTWLDRLASGVRIDR
jgi:tetratricopeptide (TPR) repeat protein